MSGSFPYRGSLADVDAGIVALPDGERISQRG
jgi:hypothetical protein